MNTIEYDASMKSFVQPHIFSFLEMLDDAVEALPDYVAPLPHQTLQLVASHVTGEDFSDRHPIEAIVALDIPYEAGLAIVASITSDTSNPAYCEETELRIKNACY